MPARVSSSPALRLAVGGLVATVALVVAGCGSSSSSGTSSITVGAEPGGSSTAAATGANSTATTAAASTTVSTPTTGPLAKRPAVTVPTGPAPNHLVIRDLISGHGPVARAGANLTVNYVGVLFHGGKEFDASWRTGQPFSFPLGQGGVIAGWDQGVAGMRVGGRRELVIPASLAYGAQARPGIPANSPLVFVIDLLGVQG